MTVDIPAEVIGDINKFRYREQFGLSYAELLNEPAEELNRALFIWSLDAERDKLEAERNKQP